MTSDLQLMLLMGRRVPVPVPAALMDAVQTVQVTVPTTGASGFQVTFAVSARSVISPRAAAHGVLRPQDPRRAGRRRRGAPKVLVDGVITRQEVTPADEPGASTLTITGEDLSVVMDLRHETSCYPAMARHVRVMVILAKYADVGHRPGSGAAGLHRPAQPGRKIPIQASTDLAYIKALATEVGYVFYMRPGPAPGVNVAYWGPEMRVGPQPALSVGMGRRDECRVAVV